MIVQIIVSVIMAIMTIVAVAYGVYLLKQAKKIRSEKKYVYHLEEIITVKEFKNGSSPIKSVHFNFELVASGSAQYGQREI